MVPGRDRAQWLAALSRPKEPPGYDVPRDYTFSPDITRSQARHPSRSRGHSALVSGGRSVPRLLSSHTSSTFGEYLMELSLTDTDVDRNGDAGYGEEGPTNGSSSRVSESLSFAHHGEHATFGACSFLSKRSQIGPDPYNLSATSTLSSPSLTHGLGRAQFFSLHQGHGQQWPNPIPAWHRDHAVTERLAAAGAEVTFAKLARGEDLKAAQKAQAEATRARNKQLREAKELIRSQESPVHFDDDPQRHAALDALSAKASTALSRKQERINAAVAIARRSITRVEGHQARRRQEEATREVVQFKEKLPFWERPEYQQAGLQDDKNIVGA